MAHVPTSPPPPPNGPLHNTDPEARAKTHELLHLSTNLDVLVQALESSVGRRAECVNFLDNLIAKIKLDGMKDGEALEVRGEGRGGVCVCVCMCSPDRLGVHLLI